MDIVTTTSKRYADCFGFTEQEVFSAMDEYGLTDKEAVKQWYDGFIFGRTKEIYNPWSITKYLETKDLAPYWAQSGSNALLSDLIKNGGLGVQEEMARLLQGKSITLSMDEQIDFSLLSTHSRAIWSLLMAAGYVKALRVDPATEEYTLTLTNQEVHFILKNLISDWFTIDYYANTGTFCKALLADDIPRMNAILNRITHNTCSFFTKNPEPERFYHAFVLGLIVDLTARYEIRSNRESGEGRYDVCLFPKQSSDRGIGIEFKTRKADEENDLHETCENALTQIAEKHSANELKAWNCASIFTYGFAFDGKKVLICGGATQ
ncbi:MAG: PD-(D/E)XK nuclease domain-containing protein [Desulfovibrio sp.]|nr:PD-(D/E)XK nuclease domain-containing protein [Desulfovibrio sp.]